MFVLLHRENWHALRLCFGNSAKRPCFVAYELMDWLIERPWCWKRDSKSVDRDDDDGSVKEIKMPLRPPHNPLFRLVLFPTASAPPTSSSSSSSSIVLFKGSFQFAFSHCGLQLPPPRLDRRVFGVLVSLVFYNVMSVFVIFEWNSTLETKRRFFIAIGMEEKVKK